MVGTLALAVLVAAIWRPWRPAVTATAKGADAASVAVLMFDNLTGSTADQYLSDGMTDEVIRQLARVRSLKVISRTSSEALRGTRLTLRQIADTLGVRHVLEGAVRHAGSRIRVTVDLIDAATDAHVWTSVYDRDLTDIFAVQEEIARTVADSLGRMIGVSPTVGRVARTEQPEAYEAYLVGNSLLYRRTLEGLRGARDQFQQTIARDSTYAPAYAGLASAYFLWDIYSYAGIDLFEAWGRALGVADRAIALDSSVVDAYMLRGITMAFAWAPAESVSADLERALALQPNSANVHQWYAQFLSREGRYEEALDHSAQAVALDPLSPGVRLGYSAVALIAHRYDIAAREAQRAATLQPGLMQAHWMQALGYVLSGDAPRCAAVDLGPYAGLRAVCLHAMGRPAEAARIADSLRTSFLNGTAGDSTFSPVIAARGIASYFAWTGNARESLAWLERAYAVSPIGGDLREIGSGLYDKVRNDPGFMAGIKRLQAEVFQRVEAERRRFGVK
jgi:TolB-like protein/tetratricopeptide (TPR) repeat protein